MEVHLQRTEDDGDDKLTIFPWSEDQRIVDYNKRI
jgi:hypothetical protein